MMRKGENRSCVKRKSEEEEGEGRSRQEGMSREEG
jgi:hypothetical protein